MNATISTKPPHTTISSANPLEAAREACRRIAPLWPLQNFVAVNPFVGLSDRSFIDICALIRRIATGGMQMNSAFYFEKLTSGEITEADLEAALDQARKTLGSPWSETLPELNGKKLIAALPTPVSETESDEILTVAEAVERAHGINWTATVNEAIGQFCAAYYDDGQSAWRLPWRSLPLYAAWREMASLDANPELLGLKNFRSFVEALPKNADTAIATLLAKLGIPAIQITDFLHKELMSIRGWAGYVQFRVRENGLYGQSDDSLLQLLAVRLAYDAALLAQFDGPALQEFWPPVGFATEPSPATLMGFLWQLAHEHAWQRKLFSKLATAKPMQLASLSSRPAVQAVFCIDVRSEIFRRSLEAASPDIETIGFAGFFGLPIEYIPLGQHHGTTQCPVLLTPKFRIREELYNANADEKKTALRRQRLGKRLSYSWNSFKTSAISCFSFVETTGLAFGPQLFRDAFAPTDEARKQSCGPRLATAEEDGLPGTGIAVSDRVQLALGILRHMGLKNFAPLVLLCGHGSQTANNPYGSGLDCGACGGHAGDSNARVAAAILNDPTVRAELLIRGVIIPKDTHFVAGLHNTTTDEVTLFDAGNSPESNLTQLKNWLATAGQTARRERAPLLGIPGDSSTLDQEVFQRSRDWAQVRPEWGLAGNAAFIAAPRARTKTAKLDGRVFLHNYDHRTDAHDATLELILTAPMVVANWINLQYFASTVNNDFFGSGNKVTHNVVGTLGVCQGNGGDLQVGLPFQSVHDGTKWIHEPLRLHVLIEAPRDRISAILARHENVRQLVENGWLLLFAMEDEGASYFRCYASERWEKINPPTA